MPLTQTDIATQKQLSRDIDQLNVRIAQINQRIAAENTTITRKNQEFSRAANDSLRKSILNTLQSCERRNQASLAEIARIRTQIQQKTARWNQIQLKA